MKITNPRIEKQRAEIQKTKAKIAEFTMRLRGQEKQLRSLEDLEIIAQFRKERMSDENLSLLASDAPRHIPEANLPPADTKMPGELIKEESTQ